MNFKTIFFLYTNFPLLSSTQHDNLYYKKILINFFSKDYFRTHIILNKLSIIKTMQTWKK